MTRILPVFWVVLSLSAFINFTLKREFDLNTFALSLLGLDFWVLGKLNTWFIPSIIACYIFFPGLYMLALKYGYRRVLPAFILMAIAASILLVGTPAQHILIFTIRISVFILGVYIGFLLLNKQDSVLNNLYLNAMVVFLSLAVLGVLLLKTEASFRRLTGLWWYPTIVMAYPVAVILGSILDRLKQSSVHLVGFLKGWGLLSLEIYLIHTFIFSLASLLELKQFGMNVFRIPEYVMYVAISFFLAKLLHSFLERIDWDRIYNENFQWAAKKRTKYDG
jgi:peptidoglycan/LPS O-acetylase OafA/YrhL